MYLKGEILKSRVNSFVGILFVGSAALYASLLIWQSAHGYNPLTQVFEEHFVSIQQALDR